MPSSSCGWYLCLQKTMLVSVPMRSRAIRRMLQCFEEMGVPETPERQRGSDRHTGVKRLI